jgi:hypothetical protein
MSGSSVNNRQQTIWIVGILFALICLSGLAFFWVAEGTFRVCTPQPEGPYAKTISALNEIVELGLRFSTTLVGLGAALLIGWRPGVQLTFPIKAIILIATLLLVQSALYAVWWRFGVAELWLNDCLELITEPALGRRFQAHFYFFLAGLVSLGVLVIGALLSAQPSGENS